MFTHTAAIEQNDPHLIDDICRGLVLSLDPDVLEESGGVFVEENRIKGPHYALCLGHNGEDTIWVFLTSKPGLLRKAIPNDEHLGFWQKEKAESSVKTYYSDHGLVLAKRSQVQNAAERDLSRRGGRRYINPFYAAQIADILIPGW